ncbi:MAG: aminotransferase class I/II-fold pyridoxal phosphate-dependent enzyme [Planctomycetota bacterium]
MTLPALATVYSYYMPEVRAVVDDLSAEYPHEVFLRSVGAGLDDFHIPVIARLVERHRHDVPALGGFEHAYPTAGSEEGIRELMTTIAAGGERAICMFAGDYEGYREVARLRGLECRELPFDTASPAQVAPSWWFLSNPSARNGNLLPREIIDAVLAAGHKVFYDLSYLDSTPPAVFDLSHPNVAAAAISLSKPYGLFYYRIGFTFARQPIPSLYANKWFKNVFGLLLADRLMKSIDARAHAARYKAAQAEVVSTIEGEHKLGLVPSDAFLLAHVSPERAARLGAAQRALLAPFSRAGGYRLCLTPAFLEREGHPSE